MDKKSLASIIAIVLGFLLITAILFLQPAPTTWVVTEPGTVARVDISAQTSVSKWHGVFGNVSSQNDRTSVYLQNEVEQFNPAVIKCHDYPLYATTLEEISWENVVPANRMDIDNHLAVSSEDPLSGTNVFDKKKVFNINNNKKELPAVRTESGEGGFYTGALKQGDTLIFVTNITKGKEAFNGQLAEFQMMLPSTASEYNFFLDETASISACNKPPFFTDFRVKDKLVQEEDAYIKVWWEDPKKLPVTVSSSISDARITYPEDNMAIINWSPGPMDAGYKNVTVTLTDIYNAYTQKTKEIFIDSVNRPPVLSSVEDIDAYVYKPYEQVISAFDYKNLNNHPKNAELQFYTSPSISWLDVKTYYNSTDNHFYGIINFTAVDSQKGTREIDVIVTDGEKKDNQTIELRVGYCGDGRCDSRYEDCRICPEDCGVCDPKVEEKHFAMEIERNKTNPLTKIKTNELVKRGTCYKKGEIIRGMEVCEPLSGVDINTYILRNKTWKLIDEYETNESGVAYISTEFNESYKLKGEKEGYHNTYRFIGKGYFYVIEELEPVKIDVNVTEEEPLEPPIDEPRPIDPKLDYINLWLYYGIVFSLVLALLFLIHFFIAKKEKEDEPGTDRD